MGREHFKAVAPRGASDVFELQEILELSEKVECVVRNVK
jgi:hypothetical protein